MIQAQIDQPKIVTKISLLLGPDQNESEKNLRKVEQKNLQDPDFFVCDDVYFNNK